MKDELKELKIKLLEAKAWHQKRLANAVDAREYFACDKEQNTIGFCDQTIAKIDYMIAARTRKTAKGGGKR